MEKCGEWHSRWGVNVLKWKRTKGEPTGERDSLFVSKRGGRYAGRALELRFKKDAEGSGILARKPQLTRHTH